MWRYVMGFCFLLLGVGLFAQPAANLSQLNNELDALKEDADFSTFLKVSQRASALAKQIYGPRDSSYLRQQLREIEAYELNEEIDRALFELEKVLALLEKQYGSLNNLYLDMAQQLYFLCVTTGRLEQAQDLLQKWEPAVKALHGEESWPYGNYLDAQMTVWVYQGNFEEGAEVGRSYKALLERLDARKTDDYASIVNNLAYIYEAIGRTDEAEALYLEAKNIRLELYGAEHPSYGMLLSNLGLLHLRAGRYNQAQQYLVQSEQILRAAAPNSEQYLNTLHNLASLYHYRDSLERARGLYEKIIDLSRDLPLSVLVESDRLATEQNLAAVYIVMQEWQKAEAIFKEQVENASTVESRLLALQAWLKLDLRREDAAAEKRWRVLEKYLKRPKKWSRSTEVRTWRLGGEYYLSRNEYDKAADYLAKAIRIYLPELPDILDGGLSAYLQKLPPIALEDKWKVLRAYLQYYEQRYTDDKNRIWLERALALAEASLTNTRKRIGQITHPRDRLKILSDRRFFTAAALRSCWRLWQDFGEEAYMEKAFFLTEENKAQLIATALQSHQARIFGQLPDSLAQRELALQERQSQLTNALWQEQDRSKRADLYERLGTLDVQLQALYEEIAQDYPAYYRLRYAPVSFSVSDLQTALGEHDLLLSYFKDGEQLYSFELSQDGLRCRRQSILQADWAENYETYRNLLTDFEYLRTAGPEQMLPLADVGHWWYQRLLQPSLEQYKKAKHLIIVGDAELHYLPFETFTTQAIKGNEQEFADLPYLLKTHSSSYAYSVALWLEAARAPMPQEPQELLAIVPKFEGGETSTIKNLPPYLAELRRRLTDLPAAEAEVAGILEQVHGRALFGEAASEQKVKALVSDYGLLHFATHGILNETHPILSSLALSPNKDSLEDGFLQAYEIAQWDLKAELVVLSACETGFGRFEQGEGVMSLSRAFLQARVPALLVSLWKVNDQGTSILMRFFYEALSEGLDKAEALRQAKLRFLENAKGRNGHPAYWAPFVQLGNSRALALSRPRSFWSDWGWPLGGVLLLALGWGIWRLR